jgi:CheY-like chemotaxis protein
VKDGVAADAALGTGQFGLPILDVGLPKLSGFEILERLRNRGSTLPVAANPRERGSIARMSFPLAESAPATLRSAA